MVTTALYFVYHQFEGCFEGRVLYIVENVFQYPIKALHGSLYFRNNPLMDSGTVFPLLRAPINIVTIHSCAAFSGFSYSAMKHSALSFIINTDTYTVSLY